MRFVIDFPAIEYKDETGYVHVTGKFMCSPGSSIEIEAEFPFSFIDEASDEVIVKWRDSLFTPCTSSKHEKDYEFIEEKELPDDENAELAPLSTNDSVTKKKLFKNLQKADVPDNSRMTLKFDKNTGKFYILFYWSDGPAVIGHKAVIFDLESNVLRGDAWSWMERD